MLARSKRRKLNLIDDEEEALNEEMQKLNIHERIEADRTIVGNSTVGINLQASISDVYEEPHQLNLKFRELANTIDRIESEIGNANSTQFDTSKLEQFKAYTLAREQNATYVSHPVFTIGFLRAEQYDAEKAAYRMFRYLKIKLDLFGVEKLTQDILLDDLGDDGKRYLERGGLQVLPKRDAAGRRVVFGTGVLNGSSKASDIESAKKAYFYFWTSISEDDNEQGRIKGIVGIIWRVHKPPVPSAVAAASLSQIWLCVPMRISAYHMCYGPRSYDPQTLDRFAKVCLAWFRNKNFMRYRRAHFGEAVEILYTMMDKYGIPSHCFPINHASSTHGFQWKGRSNNSIDISNSVSPFHLDNHKNWMKNRRSLDENKKVLMTSATTILNSLRSSNGSVSVPNSLRTSNESISVEHSLIGSMGEHTGFSIMSDDDILIGGPSAINNDTSIGNGIDGSKPSAGANGTTATMAPTETINKLIAGDDVDSFENDLNESQFLSESLLGWSIRPVHAEEIAQDDIKLGRGKPLQQHPGNQWFRSLISEEFETYDSLGRREQTGLSREIVARVKREGRRFWKRQETTSDRWIEINDDEAREKVAITFRTERKKRSKN